MEAIAEAARIDVPVLFVVEDNGFSISTPTAGKTFYSPSRGAAEPQDFYGLPIHRLDGRDVVPCHRQLGPIIETIRATRRAAIVVFRVERLADHSNSDDERTYRSEDNRRAARDGRSDPKPRAAAARPRNTANHDRRDRRKRSRRNSGGRRAFADGRAAAGRVRRQSRASPEPDLVGRRISRRRRPASDMPGSRCLKPIREVLRAELAAEPRVCLFGEDIEDPKGDVFGVTRGLSTAFPGRVVNSPLSEATIVGVSIGRALAGARPVAFLQFTDFLPVTFNQIMSELSTMHWRSVGEWNCPVIVMAACGGYRPGLGPFHSQTMESIAAHLPGVDVFMPATATDAAGLLNAAFESPRPTLFLYPKVCLNDRNTTTSADVRAATCPDRQGPIRHARRPSDDRRLGQHRPALRKNRGRDRSGRDERRFDRSAIHFPLGSRGGDRIGRADRQVARRA